MLSKIIACQAGEYTKSYRIGRQVLCNVWYRVNDTVYSPVDAGGGSLPELAFKLVLRPRCHLARTAAAGVRDGVVDRLALGA